MIINVIPASRVEAVGFAAWLSMRNQPSGWNVSKKKKTGNGKSGENHWIFG
jgi:hypothetical protein